jgi:predicted flap endonuclease-1-like 5' DNA nuclease
MISADLVSYLPLILIGLAVLVFVIWLIARGARKARVVEDDSAPGIARDVLAEGAAPAQRNQALIDAPRGVDIIQGPLSAAANSQPTAAAPLGTDEEAGPEIAPAPEPDPAPAPAPAAAPGADDDLTRIKGLGPKIAALLGEFGITTFAQIAAWTPEEVERIDAKMGRFSGRITRDQWVDQARLLAAGDESTFAERFGRNG